MTAPVNRQIVLAARPQGMPKAGGFRIDTVPVPEPGDGEVLVQNLSDHLSLYPEFLAEVGGWLKAGRIKREETVFEGIESAPTAFLGLFAGDNLGKMLVRLAGQ
jgi:NADPH-dependent curcumin reductase CurA